MLCTAEGKGPQLLIGRDADGAFVRTSGKLPMGEVLYRMNVLAEPRAAPDEDLDVNTMAKEEFDY